MPIRTAADATLEDEDGRPATPGGGSPAYNGNRKTERVETTVGRVLLYEIVPPAVPFPKSTAR